jgi:hypothetical protein
MGNSFGESDISYVSYLTIKEKGERSYDYITIKGNVKNNGIMKVTQCLIKIKIYGQNNDIVSTDKLSVLGDIAPGEARTFHSMTAWIKSAKTYNLFIDEVRVKELH